MQMAGVPDVEMVGYLRRAFANIWMADPLEDIHEAKYVQTYQTLAQFLGLVGELDEERAMLLELQGMESCGERLADCDVIKLQLAKNLLERVSSGALCIRRVASHVCPSPCRCVMAGARCR